MDTWWARIGENMGSEQQRLALAACDYFEEARPRLPHNLNLPCAGSRNFVRLVMDRLARSLLAAHRASSHILRAGLR
jgi:hypothetical protein